MGRTKSTATPTTKGKRVRIKSPKPPSQHRFGNKEKQKRYKEIKNWAFITKRKVQLQSEQYDLFLEGLQKKIG